MKMKRPCRSTPVNRSASPGWIQISPHPRASALLFLHSQGRRLGRVRKLLKTCRAWQAGRKNRPARVPQASWRAPGRSRGVREIDVETDHAARRGCWRNGKQAPPAARKWPSGCGFAHAEVPFARLLKRFPAKLSLVRRLLTDAPTPLVGGRTVLPPAHRPQESSGNSAGGFGPRFREEDGGTVGATHVIISSTNRQVRSRPISVACTSQVRL